jgi:hypothetical protein
VSDIVYLDVCCLKRPFDDQRSTRIQLETAAVAALVDQAERGSGQRHGGALGVEIVGPIQLLQSPGARDKGGKGS